MRRYITCICANDEIYIFVRCFSLHNVTQMESVCVCHCCRYENCWFGRSMHLAIIPPPHKGYIESMRIWRSAHMRLEFVTPLIFSATSGMADEAYPFYKRLALLLSDKWSDHYAAVIGWITCFLSFFLLCSVIRCLRGSCSSIGSFGHPDFGWTGPGWSWAFFFKSLTVWLFCKLSSSNCNLYCVISCITLCR